MNFKDIEKKWQKKWAEAKIFEADKIDGKKKYALNTPYPYMNGFLHLGHLYTYMIPEIVARYKRMCGFNVCFPFSFHCTGSPIVSAAKRIAEDEEKQIEILRKMNVPEEEIPKFSEPEYWTQFFPITTKEDLMSLGFAIDWRRSFITTSLNPVYDKFIRWQFNKMREKNLVNKGKHPVVWCPEENTPVGDHARAEGEGETPQEYTLLKFRCQALGENVFLIAATLRPETVYGQTNMWVDPDLDYVKAEINGETWIISKECANKLSEQEYNVKTLGFISGSEMLGYYCTAPGIARDIPILPSYFCDPSVGTGLVTCVPSDAPYDWIALQDLQNDEKEINRWDLDPEMVKSIKPIPILKIEGFSDFAAKDICEKMGIENQEDPKLPEATQTVYKAGFHKGILNENCGSYAGQTVEKAKEKMKQSLIESGQATIMFDLSHPVVCRCLSPCVIKVVSDQWFISYHDEEWKKKTHKCLDNMTLYPEKVRKQFDYVIDWLNAWACTREFGLGTKLPWDEKWVIESLSDSTFQMTYYTVAQYLENAHNYGFSLDNINDSFFDFIFLGSGDAADVSSSTGIPKDDINKIRDEFTYWYPYDFRNSGKDLVQNHLTFSLFVHSALLPEELWPRSYEVNGRILIDNEKMAKSKGNFFTIRQLINKSDSVDALRLTTANSGEGIDDANFKMDFLDSAYKKLSAWCDFVQQNYNNGSDRKTNVDIWFETVMARLIKESSDSLDNMLFKTAVQKSFLDMQRFLKWYLRRTNNEPNKDTLNKFIEIQTQLLSPFAPHICEELWEFMGKSGFISESSWPDASILSVDKKAEQIENAIKKTLDDSQQIIKILGRNPSKIYYYVIPPEFNSYNESVTFLEKEFNCEVLVFSVADKDKIDPENKAKKARPGKPGIYME